MTATLIGYARCSTDRQDLTAQRQLLLGLGVADDRIYLDHGLTGTNRHRPGLAQALAAVRAGDTLVVPKLDRLARSVPDARDIGDSLVARGVKLSLGGAIYDPADPMGKLFSTSWPPSPNSRPTCYACAPARAWPSPAPRAGCAASSQSSAPASRPTSSSSTRAGSTPSPSWPNCSACHGRRCTGSWNAPAQSASLA